MTDPIVLIGGGGHCKSCIDVIEHQERFSITGILDNNLKIGDKVCGYPVLGSDDLIESFIQKNYFFLITVGQIKNFDIRDQIFTNLKKHSASLPVIQSPFAVVSKRCKISEGTIIMHFALINSMAEIGENCIINNKALIEHDTVIGNNAHISTAAIVNGNCKIGKNVFVGSNAVINQGVSIIDNAIIGAGAVVIQNIESVGTYIGNPARKK